jgi:hypothetical protein
MRLTLRNPATHAQLEVEVDWTAEQLRAWIGSLLFPTRSDDEVPLGGAEKEGSAMTNDQTAEAPPAGAPPPLEVAVPPRRRASAKITPYGLTRLMAFWARGDNLQDRARAEGIMNAPLASALVTDMVKRLGGQRNKGQNRPDPVAVKAWGKLTDKQRIELAIRAMGDWSPLKVAPEDLDGSESASASA